MAGIFGVKDLSARKRALAAESEVYRQTLALEIQTLRVHGRRSVRRFTSLASGPLVEAVSVAGFMLRGPLGRFMGPRRRPVWVRMGTAALVGWRLYRRFGPLMEGWFAAPKQPTPPQPAAGATGEPAVRN